MQVAQVLQLCIIIKYFTAIILFNSLFWNKIDPGLDSYDPAPCHPTFHPILAIPLWPITFEFHLVKFLSASSRHWFCCCKKYKVHEWHHFAFSVLTKYRFNWTLKHPVAHITMLTKQTKKPSSQFSGYNPERSQIHLKKDLWKSEIYMANVCWVI